MPIRPLEKKQKDGFIPKLVFLLILLCVAFVLNLVMKNKQKEPETILGAENIQKLPEVNLIKDIASVSNNMPKNIVTQTKEVAENIVETTSNILNTVTSKSSETISNALFDSAIGKVIEQVKKLPAPEQEKVKQEICK
jgi:hypothetical protein